MMMHKSPAMRVLCMASWAITAIVAIAVGATPMGWNFLGGWFMSMPVLYYIVLAAGVLSAVAFGMHLSCNENCH